MESRSECVHVSMSTVIFSPVVIAGTLLSVSIGSDILHCIFCELKVVTGAKLLGWGEIQGLCL